MPDILLKNGHILLFDEEDYKRAIKYNWVVRIGRNGKYAVTTQIKKHRYSVAQLVFGVNRDFVISHKNSNDFDFRRDYIEIFLRKDYFHIKAKGPGLKKSLYNNIYWDCYHNSWGVRVIKNKKSYYGGRYRDEEDAAVVADFLSISLYGILSNRNFPEISVEEIKTRYKDIQSKYGETTNIKYARSKQGISPNKTTKKSSKYVGVYEIKKVSKWAAEIRYNKVRYCLGRHLEEDEAARAYDIKAIELMGESAKTNFSIEDYVNLIAKIK